MSQTINQAIQLRVGAEDIATLGKQDPQLVLGELGGFALMNKEGKNKTIVNFSDTIRQAWSQLLQTLQERNIPIPDILRSPRFTPVSQDLSAGIFLFPDRLEVSGWIKQGTEAAEGETAVAGYILYPLEEPITIPLDTPLDSHLTLHNASDYDVWIPLSEDGVEMYEYIPDFEGTGTHVYHWNREWVRAVGHQPVALEILNHGWTDRLNAAFLRNLRADYTQLRKDFDEYKQSHP